MSEVIIPSFYQTRSVGPVGQHDAFNNIMLRPGEVKRIIYPEDERSRTKKFLEYDVLVQHRENGTLVNKMYHNVFRANELGGAADYDFQTLRPAPAREGADDDVGPGLGTKVLLLCVNGAHSDAVIISGAEDERRTDVGRKTKGHHKEWVFNGVAFTINDDGSLVAEVRGPTTAAGKLDTSRGGTEAAAGTTIKVEKNGNLTLHTKDKKQYIEINHEKGTTTVHADKDLTVHGKTVHIGHDANEHAVLGDTLVDLMGQLIDAILVETHGTPDGTSGPPLNAVQYQAIKRKLKTCLSEFTYVKKKP